MWLNGTAIALLMTLLAARDELPLIHFSLLRSSSPRASPAGTSRGSPGLISFAASRLHDPSIAPRGERRRVAVLTFSTEGASETSAWLSRELADSIVRKLAAVSGLEFVDRALVMRLEKHLEKRKGGPACARAMRMLARRAGADIVVAGRYRSEEERVEAELDVLRPSAGAKGRVLRFSGSAKSLWALEARLAVGVAGLLGVNLSDTEKERMRTSPTSSALAFKQFSLARQEPDGSSRRIQFLQQACEADPGFAKAHYLLGNAYFGIGMTYRYVEWFNRALAEYRRTVSLDPACAEAYCAMGLVYIMNGRCDLAGRAMKRALELDPEMKLAWGYLRGFEGRGY